MDIRTELKYTDHDEWIKVEGQTAVLGITDYAQGQLSDIVFFEVEAEVGANLAKGSIFGTVESVKAASEVYMPISGEIIAINGLLSNTPELINADPYGDAWMVKIKIDKPAELEVLMDADSYTKFCQEREH